MVLNEAEAHVRVRAKIAIDSFKMSRPLRSRSFSWRSRAISEAWSAKIGVACVVGRHAADAGSRRNLSTQRHSTESRKPSSLAATPTARHHQFDRLALAVLCERSTLTV